MLELLTTRHLCVAGPHILHEQIDGEVVIIDLTTGAYFSLDGVGAEVWGCLNAGATPEAIIGQIARSYSGTAHEITAGVLALLAVLEEARLIGSAASSTGTTPAAESLPPDQSPLPVRRPFSAPTLAAFTDMQALLALDPVHEIDAMGWPSRRQGEE